MTSHANCIKLCNSTLSCQERMQFPGKLHNKQQNFTLTSRSSPGLQRDICILTLTITFGRSRGCSVDTMQKPWGKIGGCRVRLRSHTMARTVSMYLPLTCPRTLQRNLQMMKEHTKHLRPNISRFVKQVFGLVRARGVCRLLDHPGDVLLTVPFLFLSPTLPP